MFDTGHLLVYGCMLIGIVLLMFFLQAKKHESLKVVLTENEQNLEALTRLPGSAANYIGWVVFHDNEGWIIYQEHVRLMAR